MGAHAAILHDAGLTDYLTGIDATHPLRIAIVSDAWTPQVNGVVRTLGRTIKELTELGHHVDVIAPSDFHSLPCPTYPEIRLALMPKRGMARQLDRLKPDAIHIATEGPLGHAARAYCRARKLPFSTAYHTRFPEYVAERFAFPTALSYAVLRRFHAPAQSIMVATRSIAEDLASRGFRNIRAWSRGVDLDLFKPRINEIPALLCDLPRPLHLYVGRVAVEKNIEAFLALDLPGTKVVVGDGPQRAALQRRFPKTIFAGAKHGVDLAQHYAAADVFVFPSLTDTFGLVVLEALASGVPVAAFPVAGPKDVLGDSGAGALDWDLARAVQRAIMVPPARCRAHAETFSWRAATDQFLANLALISKPLQV
ncbi:MAG: glycosyltransferase family 1 protein [Rhodospirillaceae bacterium]|nr:MAG: glycosyltransferase family 1 protein [Rhodospirillaceae bacterium]